MQIHNDSQIFGKCEHGPIVVDSTEVGILGIGQLAIVDELRPNDDILSCLEGDTRTLGASKLFNWVIERTSVFTPVVE